jgi:hypothetical protein
LATDVSVQIMVNATHDLGNGQSNVTFIWLDRASLSSYTLNRFITGTLTQSWTLIKAGLPAGVAGLWRNYTVTVTNGVEYEFQ